MRFNRPIAVAIAVLLLAVATVGMLFFLNHDDRFSQALAGSRPATETISAATATEPPTATASPSPTPSATSTPLPPPTATPVPPPPPPPPTQAALPPPVAPEQPAPPPPQPSEWLDVDFAARVLALVNSERAARGVPALAANGALSQSAQAYARTLIRFDALSHSADGTSVLDRARAAGYGGGPPMGEVLWASTGYLPPERVVGDWMGSESHRSIILDPVYGDAGVGCYFREADLLRARCVMDLAG